MRPISPKVKEELDKEPDICALRQFGGCSGRITREHVLTFGGKQIDEVWAIIKICARHHSVDEWQDRGLLDKEKNLWVALNRAEDWELEKYSKVVDYKFQRARLNIKYGIPSNSFKK